MDTAVKEKGKNKKQNNQQNENITGINHMIQLKSGNNPIKNNFYTGWRYRAMNLVSHRLPDADETTFTFTQLTIQLLLANVQMHKSAKKTKQNKKKLKTNLLNFSDVARSQRVQVSV